MQTRTPAYVFSCDEFRERAEQVRSVLGENIGLCYSIKANPFLLAHLPQQFKNVEVCSPGELSICMRSGVPAEMIIYSGLNKGEEDIARALEYGAGIITAESRLHLDLIEKCAEKAGKTAKVLVRASAGSQFGIDRKEIPQILSEHESYPSISFEGIHFFTGTQKRKAKEIIRELAFLEKYVTELREATGLALEKIEYGTGLPSYLFCDTDHQSVQDAHAAEIAMLEEIAPHLQHLAEMSELTIEMGRFFASSCGHYFTKVVDIKTNDGINYAIIDGGSHQIRYFGQMQGMQIPFITHVDGEDRNGTGDKTTDAGDNKWTVCGSLCTTADVLARNAEIDDLQTGDVLVMHQAGAYALYECMSLFLSRDLPRIYLYDNGTLTLHRDRIDSDIYNTPL